MILMMINWYQYYNDDITRSDWSIAGNYERPWVKKLLPSFLYSMLMTGVVLDGNPGGALRAIKDADKWKEETTKIAN